VKILTETLREDTSLYRAECNVFMGSRMPRRGGDGRGWRPGETGVGPLQPVRGLARPGQGPLATRVHLDAGTRRAAGQGQYPGVSSTPGQRQGGSSRSVFGLMTAVSVRETGRLGLGSF